MTNIVLNVLVLLALVAVSWRVLTMVFDTVMIAADLYVFDEDKILGVYLWGAPLEDFAYAIAAALAMPVLWTVLEGRDARRAHAAGAAPTTAPGEGA